MKMDAFSLENKLALITGGGSGIGFGIAKTFVHAGAKVVISGRREKVLVQAVAQLGGNASYIVNDVTDFDKFPLVVNQIEKDNGPIDILVNNAGMHLKKCAQETTDAEFFKVIINTNLLGVFSLTRVCAEKMLQRKSGCILMMSSMTAFFGMDRVVAYSVSKTALTGMLNSRQFAQIANERAINDGQPIPFSDLDAASAINTNWQDEVFQTGLTQNYSLGFSGGSEQTQYYASGSYLDQEGAVLKSGFTGGSFRLNLDQKVGQRLSLSSQMFVSRSKANRTQDGIIQNALGMPPINSPYDANGNYTPGDVLLSYPFSDSGGDSPLVVANERLDQLTIGRFLGNLRGRYEIMDDLSLELMLGADQTSNIQDSYSTRLIRGNADGSGSERRTETQYYVIEGLLQYATNIHEGQHKINATAGFTREMQTSRFISASSAGFVTDDFSNRNLGAGERFEAPQNGVSEWDILSFLGRVNYILQDKYLFTVSGRRDGSSRFGEGNKWGFFPSAAFAWRMANESFLSNSQAVSDMKLRLSWGKTGNQAISPYESLQRFEPQVLVIGDNVAIGFAPDNLGNPDLKWETTEQINAGVDVGLLDQRIRLTVDLYQKKTTDLLAVVNLPPNSGFRTTLQNIGSMENRGIEINAAVDIIRDKQDFNWTVNFNIASNRNKVTELARDADIIAPNINFVGAAHILREGEPLSAFYGMVEDGLTDDGLIKFVDQNDDGSVNALDRVILGDPYPDFTYGLNTTWQAPSPGVPITSLPSKTDGDRMIRTRTQHIRKRRLH